ncbi:hypothetical protein ANO11243_077470 [Dothideomycetidae sp. 11243]|nr:hypothetical protein ANO11243_077470 [fungal sp. No.11243]
MDTRWSKSPTRQKEVFQFIQDTVKSTLPSSDPSRRVFSLLTFQLIKDIGFQMLQTRVETLTYLSDHGEDDFLGILSNGIIDLGFYGQPELSCYYINILKARDPASREARAGLSVLMARARLALHEYRVVLEEGRQALQMYNMETPIEDPLWYSIVNVVAYMGEAHEKLGDLEQARQSRRLAATTAHAVFGHNASNTVLYRDAYENFLTRHRLEEVSE